MFETSLIFFNQKQNVYEFFKINQVWGFELHNSQEKYLDNFLKKCFYIFYKVHHLIFQTGVRHVS